MGSDTERRIAHLTRWATATVFTLAVRWLGRLSTRERLVLATRAVGTRTRADAEHPSRDQHPQPSLWTDVTSVLWQADLLQRALTNRVVDGVGTFLDLEELREPGMDLAAAIKEAGTLLTQLHALDDPDESPVEPMALQEIVGHRRRLLSLTELRQARDLGLVQDFTADMDRRAVAGSQAAVAGSQATVGSRPWTVRWASTGRFTASADAALAVVEGWAAHPVAVADVLTSWSIPPRRVEPKWWGGGPPPSDLQQLCAYEPSALPHISVEHAEKHFWAEPDRLAEVVAVLQDLRQSWSIAQVPGMVTGRIIELQDREPQLPDVVGAFAEPGVDWSKTMAAEWVPTRNVVRTADEVWGEFARGEVERQAQWVPDRARELLAVPPANLPQFLATHFVGSYQGATVQLQRIPGPAGPLYVLGYGGSHRTHLSRILGLPWLFAVTTLVPMPRHVQNTTVTPSEGGPEACLETAALWQGLLDHNVIRGRLITHHPEWVVELRLDHAPAPWVLLPAEPATAYNQRYELLHPGALAAAGIPLPALDGPDAWRAWLTAG